eukprot:CAMPEP_0184411174 /NCGR_PEP_ID=MMETSP0738-20130409/5444_1 /TAXON_ID=385413 /ORGANISM="Thalassiosira miniscula, Strain CCMP1093" /LENGTH=53 /DNA_ID=CAMNT_0026769335 /DNA_START=14 /DNA_END=172 /DNA_ORIENTATION=+
MGSTTTVIVGGSGSGEFGMEPSPGSVSGRRVTVTSGPGETLCRSIHGPTCEML